MLDAVLFEVSLINCQVHVCAWERVVCACVRERRGVERERKREGGTDRQTERQTDRQTDRDRECVCVFVCV